MPSEPFQFHISDTAQALGLKAVCFVIEGVRNQPTHPDFEKLKAQTLAQVTADLSSEAIQADPVLGGFRALYDAIGRSNRKNVASPESLLKLVLQTGGLPQVNLLVDIYNRVSPTWQHHPFPLLCHVRQRLSTCVGSTTRHQELI